MFESTPPREIYGGYARPLGSRASWEIGVVSYVFPRPSVPPGYDYTEVFMGLSFDTVSARLYYSNDYFGGGARSVYTEVNGSHQIGEHAALLAHVGFLGQHQPDTTSDTPPPRSAFDFKAGVAIDVADFTLELSVVGTTVPNDACAVGTRRCTTTPVLSVSKRF
jgi:uncharacterized protein (TIGR02001 family)